MRAYPSLVPSLVLSLLLAPPLAAQKFTSSGQEEGIAIGYRWLHPVGRPSELLLRLENTTAEDRQLSLELALSHQGFTVETMHADTCMEAGATLVGKMNGFWFRPSELTTAQIKSGAVDVEITRAVVNARQCP